MNSEVRPDDLQLQRLYRWERTIPDRVALTQPMGGGIVRDLTWREMMDETRRMAAHLKSLGFEPGARIGLLSKNTAHWLMADFAIWMAGYVSVPLYPSLAAGTIRQILTHSEARLLFVGKLDGWDAMRDGVPTGLPMIRFPLSPPVDCPAWDEIVTSTQPLQGEPVRDGNELATIIYTSGTTGTPKGVMHSFATFAWSIGTVLRRIGAHENGRVLSYLPLAHVAERTVVEHGMLGLGLHVYFAESLETFAADIRRARPTIFFSVPRLWVKFQQGVLAKMPAAKLDRLLRIPVVRRIVARRILRALGLDQCEFAAGGAAPMPAELLKWYRRLGLRLSEVYGMTENCGVSHATLPDVPRPGTVGPGYDGIQSRVDPETGELQVKCPGVMLGYYKEPELTRQAMTGDGWLRTGDKGEFDAEGNLRIVGRVKDLFKTGKGKYVAPAPIEDRLVTHVAVEACCVTGANLGQPLALLMLNAETSQRIAEPAHRDDLEQSLSAHLDAVNALLDPHEQLDCVVVVRDTWTVENDLVTPTLKVKRNRIEAVYATHYESWVGKRRPVVWQ
ncbi:MAG TPA: AMP-binding protein [Steroidobacteraceae bacterium]|nr:AMP-binding protein [Steroidobacteraceae bacterium]